MRSLVYNGVDLSEWCSAEVVEKVALPVVSETMVVPGRAARCSCPVAYRQGWCG